MARHFRRNRPLSRSPSPTHGCHQFRTPGPRHAHDNRVQFRTRHRSRRHRNCRRKNVRKNSRKNRRTKPDPHVTPRHVLSNDYRSRLHDGLHDTTSIQHHSTSKLARVQHHEYPHRLKTKNASSKTLGTMVGDSGSARRTLAIRNRRRNALPGIHRRSRLMRNSKAVNRLATRSSDGSMGPNQSAKKRTR